MKKLLKNIAVGIKTIETVQQRYPSKVLFMLFSRVSLVIRVLCFMSHSNQFNFNAYFTETVEVGSQVQSFFVLVSGRQINRPRQLIEFGTLT